MKFRLPDGIKGDAKFSSDGLYRYSLSRRWSDGPAVMFVMLNPSDADAEFDDHTQLRCRGFAKSWGYSGYYAGNLFGYISKDPRKLMKVVDPVGPENDFYLLKMVKSTARTILAWGHQSRLVHRRASEVIELLGAHRELYVIRLTKDGCPSHPSHLAGSLRPLLFARSVIE